MNRFFLLLIILLPALTAVAQRYEASPGEYYNLWLDKAMHTVWQIKGNAQPIRGLPKTIVAVAAGTHHEAFLDGSGNVYTLGDNNDGELGIGNTAGANGPQRVATDNKGNTFGKVIQIVCGGGGAGSSYGWSTAAVKSDGTVWAWGWLHTGLAGDGTAGGVFTRPVQIRFPAGVFIKKICFSQIGIALDALGNVYTWGGNDGVNLWFCNLGQGSASPNWSRPTKILLPGPAIDIAGGNNWHYALLKSGKLYGWSPFLGFLGVGFGNGGPYQYETPYGGTLRPILLDSALRFRSPITGIWTNNNASYARLSDSSAWAWGDNSQGACGNGFELNFSTYKGVNGVTPYQWDQSPCDYLQRKPVQIAPGLKVRTIYTNNALSYYAFAEDYNGHILGWGRNKAGLLGNGVIPCNASSGHIAAQYPNAFDQTRPVIVTPIGQALIPSVPQLCIGTPTAPYCPECAVFTSARPRAAFKAIVIGHNKIVLDGSKSVGVYRLFQQTGGPSLQMGIQTWIRDTIYNVAPGNYSFSLKVTDAKWNSDSSVVSLVVH